MCTATTKDEGYKNLANEIILSAVSEYKHALKRNKETQIQECESFFHSGWFSVLTDIEPSTIINNMRREYQHDNTRDKSVA